MLAAMHTRLSKSSIVFLRAEAKRQGLPMNAILDTLIQQARARKKKKVK